MNRKGKPLTVLPTGHPRRMADGKNAWRKMNPTQREEFVLWLAKEGLAEALADVNEDTASRPPADCAPAPLWISKHFHK